MTWLLHLKRCSIFVFQYMANFIETSHDIAPSHEMVLFFFAIFFEGHWGFFSWHGLFTWIGAAFFILIFFESHWGFFSWHGFFNWNSAAFFSNIFKKSLRLFSHDKTYSLEMYLLFRSYFTTTLENILLPYNDALKDREVFKLSCCMELRTTVLFHFFFHDMVPLLDLTWRVSRLKRLKCWSVILAP